MRPPGLEPGPPTWKVRIIPLDYERLYVLNLTFQIQYHNYLYYMDFQQSQDQNIQQNQKLNLKLKEQLQDLLIKTKNIPPPENSPQDLIKIYEFLLSNDQQGVEELQCQLKKFPDMKLQEIVQNIEKLYLQLQIEYDQEINRGNQLGILTLNQQSQNKVKDFNQKF